MKKRAAALMRGLAFPALMLLLWDCGSRYGWWSEFILPGPGKVISTFCTLTSSGELIRHAAASLARIAKGFSLSAVFAFIAAFAAGSSTVFLRYAAPTLELLRHIPPMAAIPLLILWFGIGEASKLAIITMATFFPIFLNTLHGIAECDRSLIEVAQIFGFSRAQIARRVVLPCAVPSVITGMRLGLGYSWRSLIAAELVAASSGLGYMIIDAGQLSRPDVVITGVLVIGVLGTCIDALFIVVTARLRWSGGRIDAAA